MGAGALLASAWVTVPLLAQGRFAATNEILVHTPLVNGYGAKQVMSWLVTGQLFDAHRFPVVTLLAGAGLIVCVRRWHSQATGRAVVALLVMSLVLSFGRTTFGGLTVLLPGGKDIFLRRFMMGAQLSGLYLAGIGGAAVMRSVAAGVARWRPRAATWAARPSRRGVLVACAGVVGLAALTPAWSQIDAFGATNAHWIAAAARRGRLAGW